MSNGPNRLVDQLSQTAVEPWRSGACGSLVTTANGLPGAILPPPINARGRHDKPRPGPALFNLHRFPKRPSLPQASTGQLGTLCGRSKNRRPPVATPVGRWRAGQTEEYRLHHHCATCWPAGVSECRMVSRSNWRSRSGEPVARARAGAASKKIVKPTATV